LPHGFQPFEKDGGVLVRQEWRAARSGAIKKLRIPKGISFRPLLRRRGHRSAMSLPPKPGTAEQTAGPASAKKVT